MNIPSLLASLALLSSLLSASSTTELIKNIQPLESPTIIQVESKSELDIYLDKLSYCESRGSWTAINPNDSDNTPSYGEFQFKPGTFTYFGKKYGLPATDIFNGDEQRAIVKRMAEELSTESFHKQFPGCTNKIGYYIVQ